MKITLCLISAILIQATSLIRAQHQLKDFSVGFGEIKACAFSSLDKEFENVRIVGFGEDTHGTSEFTKLAEELMLYLNDKHEFNTLIIETGFGEGLYLNDFIHGKRDDLKSILFHFNSTWRYQTEEFMHLMNALKKFNQENDNKISIFGCEMQYVLSDVNRIKDYLKSIETEYEIEGFEKHLWQTMEESEKSDLYISYIQLKNYFTENYQDFIHKSSEESFNLAFHHIEVIGQYVTTIHQPVIQRKYDFRDIYMAENIEWILNFQGENSKVLFWAHNAHVGDWVSNGIVDVAGHQLRKRFGETYFNIATDFGVGEFIAFPYNADEIGWKLQTYNRPQVVKNTFSFELQQMGKPNTILNLKEARKSNTLKLILQEPLTHMSGAGANASRVETVTDDIGNAFDAIIYIHQTSKINFVELK